jgi:predicted TIM-barrel fold metal-dependent hydrolase
VEELRFAKDHGACGVMKKGVEAGYRPAGDPYFYPLYEEAERLDLPLCIHQGTGDSSISNTSSVTDTANMSVLNVLNAFKSLAMAGVPDMYPRLRFGFIEAGASWIPYLIKDMGMRGKAEKSAYDFKTGFLAHNRFYITCDTEDDIPALLEYGGEDYLMIGTDYSHSDPSSEMLAHQVVMKMAEEGKLDPKVANKIVEDNGRTFYGF